MAQVMATGLSPCYSLRSSCASIHSSATAGCRRVEAAHTGKGIADAAVGLNQLLREVAIYLAAQSADVHVDHVGQTLERGVPDMLQDHGARHRPIYVAYQVFEQQKFLGPQIDGLTQPRDSSPHQIQFQITGAQ